MTRTPDEAIYSYITDMLALEDHLGRTLDEVWRDRACESGELAKSLV